MLLAHFGQVNCTYLQNILTIFSAYCGLLIPNILWKDIF